MKDGKVQGFAFLFDTQRGSDDDGQGNALKRLALDNLMPGERLVLISNAAIILLIMADLKSSQYEVRAIKLVDVGDVLDVSFDEVDGGDFYLFDGLDADEDEKEAVGFGRRRENPRLKGVEKDVGPRACERDALLGQHLRFYLWLLFYLFLHVKLQRFRMLLLQAHFLLLLLILMFLAI